MKLIQASIALAILSLTPAARASFAYDSAADAAYNGGWIDGTNGGFGFDPWRFYNDKTDTRFTMADSTNGGAHGGINTAGRAFAMKYNPGEGIAAIRNFSSLVMAGSQFDIDLIHQDATPNSYSVLDVYSDVGIGIGCHIDSDLIGLDFFGFEYYNLQMPTADGVHFSIAPLASGQLKVSITSLQTNLTQSVTSTYNNYHNLMFFDVSRVGNGPADTTFVNNLAVNAVPEPATMSVLALGTLALVRRRQRLLK